MRIVYLTQRLPPGDGETLVLPEAEAFLAKTLRGIDFELRLAGEGPERAALPRQVDRLRIGDRVRRLGTVPHVELLQRYRERRVDCVVLPSVDLGGGLHEGISVALTEAMAQFLAGGAGLLAERGDPDSLAGALERMLRSPGLREELALAGRRRIEQEFAVRIVARELERRFADG